MVFSSYVFIFGFLPATLVGFWIISKFDHRLAKLWLCAASVVFYGWWETVWVPVLLVSILFNYLVATYIIRQANRDQPTGLPLALGVACNLAALIYWKYLFSLLAFFHLSGLMPAPRGLPLGISFFTFTQIAFLVDVSQGFHQRYSFINYLLFVTFFPHLIAGPIVHHRDLMPQFEERKNYLFQPNEFAVGLAIFSIGLAKKTMIADNVALIADRLLQTGHVGPAIAWTGALAYSMQLYFDFSGYSDMAIGLARMFGIKFPVNFDSPYKATNIIDFWQRWHITLTRFLTAYLYNPIALRLVRRRASAGLSTSKRASRTVRGFLELIALPTVATMVIAGIWHGAGLQFIVFGALHGLYISINHAWRTFGPKSLGALSASPRTAAVSYGLLVYMAVLVAQIFFRSGSAGEAMTILGDMSTVPALLCGSACAAPETLLQQVTAIDLAILAFSMVLVWFAPNTQQIMANFDPVLDLGRQLSGSPFLARFAPGWAVCFAAVLFLGLVSVREGQPFIYFQF